MKNTAKHTKGEWNISKHATPEYAPQFGIYAEDGNDFVIVKGEKAEANAKIIAAAPELLEALNLAFEEITMLNNILYRNNLYENNVTEENQMQRIKVILSAIKKATE